MIRNSMMGVSLMTMSNASAVSFISMNDNFFPGCYAGWSMEAEMSAGFLMRPMAVSLRRLFSR